MGRGEGGGVQRHLCWRLLRFIYYFMLSNSQCDQKQLSGAGFSFLQTAGGSKAGRLFLKQWLHLCLWPDCYPINIKWEAEIWINFGMCCKIWIMWGYDFRLFNYFWITMSGLQRQPPPPPAWDREQHLKQNQINAFICHHQTYSIFMVEPAKYLL